LAPIHDSLAHGISSAARDLHADTLPDVEPLPGGEATETLPADGWSRTRRPPLTTAEETTLAKRIEDGKRRLVDALVESPAALTELARVAREVAEHSAEPLELATAAFVSDAEVEQVATAMEDAIRRLGRSGGRSARTRRARGKEPARAELIGLFAEYGLSHRAVDRVLAALATHAGSRPSNETRSRSTQARIRAARRDIDVATATLVEANMGLVYWMATKRGRALLPLADLVQEGTLGLMRAVEKFDYRRGVRFNTYAAWWIRHAINRALSDQSRTIRIPVHLLETRHKLARIARELAHEQGRDPSAVELANRTGILPETIRAVAAIPAEPVSMDAPLNADSDMRLGDVIADPQGESVVEGISARQVGDRLRDLLGTLTEREQEVLSLRFGVRGSDCLTFEQIGRRLSLSRERVRQIEAAALAKLRPQAAAQRLDAHLSP
jgi:RNA polymerase primary sigma factor